MTTSQNGWPASSDRSAIGVKNYMVEGTQIYLAVATAAAPLLLAFAKWFNEHIEPLAGKVWDEWGYAYRPVRGQTVMLSNHSSGSAIDLNSATHPRLKPNTFKPDKVALIRAECKRLGLRWGGDYSVAIVDEMHFEVNMSMYEAHVLIAQLQLQMPKEKSK